MKSNLFLITLLALVPLLSNSQNWIETVDNERQLIEVDFASIKRTEGVVYVWTKTSYKHHIEYYLDKKMDNFKRSGVIENRSKWSNWLYTLTYQKFDCKDNAMEIISIADYNKDGSVITRVDFEKEKRVSVPIAPESLSFAVFYLLCNKFKYKVNDKLYYLRIENIESFLDKHPNAVRVED